MAITILRSLRKDLRFLLFTIAITHCAIAVATSPVLTTTDSMTLDLATAGFQLPDLAIYKSFIFLKAVKGL